MAVLTVNTVDRAGLNMETALVAAAGGGDSFPNTGVEFVVLTNTNAGVYTVTLDIQAVVDGQVVTDRTVSMPATTGHKIVGPFPTTVYNDSNSRCNMTYSGVTNLKVAVCKLATS